MQKKFLSLALLATLTMSNMVVYAASTNPCDNPTENMRLRCDARQKLIDVRTENAARQQTNVALRTQNTVEYQGYVSSSSGTIQESIKSLNTDDKQSLQRAIETRNEIKTSLVWKTLEEKISIIPSLEEANRNILIARYKNDPTLLEKRISVFDAGRERRATILDNNMKNLTARSDARLNQVRVYVETLRAQLPKMTAEQVAKAQTNIATQIKNISASKIFTAQAKSQMLELLGSVQGIKTVSLELKTATVAPPVENLLVPNSLQEIGRFAISGGDTPVTINGLKFVNKGTAALAVISDEVYIADVETGDRIAPAMYASGAYTIYDMRSTLPAYTTKNYKIMANIGDVKKQAGKTIALSINPKNIVAAIADSTSYTPVNLSGTAQVRTYTVSSIIKPIVTLSKKSDYVFVLTISNPNIESALNIEWITAQVRPLSGTNFTSIACLRDMDSVIKCNDVSVTSGTIDIPGIGGNLILTETLPAGSTMTKEIYVENTIDENTILGPNNTTSLDVSVKQVKYNGIKENYYVMAR